MNDVRCISDISESVVALYLGIAVEFMEIWGFGHSKIQPNKLQKANTRS